MNIISQILNIFFPNSCIECGKHGVLLCAQCTTNIPRAPQPKEPYIRALFAYHSPIIKKAIWKFKYKNTRGFATIFAPALQNEIIETLVEHLHISEKEKPLLIPIPLHRKRLTERGYNQSELLTRAIMKLSDVPLFEAAPDALVRTRATKPQARNDNKKERLENLRGAFSVLDTGCVRGRVVILVDDVTTTGATLSEARKALLLAGARDVIAFTLAH